MNKLQQEKIRKLVQQVRDGSLGRRTFLRQVVALGVSSAATYALLGQAESKAQVFGTPTTMALGEEGQPNHQLHPPQATTLMVGEENVHQPPQVTTFAIGEEDPHQGAQPTTERVGEEDFNPPPQMTTQAIGEEDQQGQLPTTKMAGEEGTPILPPQPSTRRRGEEGHCVPPQASTMAVGEEQNAVPVYPQQRPPQPRWNGWNRW
jgi:hypothetical protein